MFCSGCGGGRGNKWNSCEFSALDGRGGPSLFSFPGSTQLLMPPPPPGNKKGISKPPLRPPAAIPRMPPPAAGTLYPQEAKEGGDDFQFEFEAERLRPAVEVGDGGGASLLFFSSTFPSF